MGRPYHLTLWKGRAFEHFDFKKLLLIADWTGLCWSAFLLPVYFYNRKSVNFGLNLDFLDFVISFLLALSPWSSIKISFQPTLQPFLVISQSSPETGLKLPSNHLWKNSIRTMGNRALGDSLHTMACFSTEIGREIVAFPLEDCIHIMVDIAQVVYDSLATRSSHRCNIMSYFLTTFSSSHKISVICLKNSKGKLYYLI